MALGISSVTSSLSHRDLQADLAPVLSRVFSDDLERAYWHVDRLCLHFCYHVTRACRLLNRRTESIDQLAARLGIAPEAIYLVETILDILAEEGIGKRTGHFIEAVRECPPDDSDRLQIEARRSCPDASPVFDLIARCREHSADFVAGRKSGISAVFAQGDFALWDRLHSADRVMSIYADLIPPSLGAILRPGARILEVGGGVGAVLQRCSPDFDDYEIGQYLFTDIGQTFVQTARRTYAGDRRLGFAKLDINSSLEEQDLAPQSFDVVIGVNVVHVARHLSFSLRELRKVLKPGGYLILSEGSPPGRATRWRLDLMFAFLRDWWDVEIDPPWRLRAGFLLPSEWSAALLGCGFHDVHLLPGEDWFRGPCRGGLVIAGNHASRSNAVLRPERAHG